MADKQQEQDEQDKKDEQGEQDAQFSPIEQIERASTETDAPSQSAPPPPQTSFPIVGIGASAGGLEALEEFFHHIPTDSAMAFVVVTHQPAAHVSLLPELLRNHSSMAVQEVTAGVKVEPGHIYLSQPAQHAEADHDRPEVSLVGSGGL